MAFVKSIETFTYFKDDATTGPESIVRSLNKGQVVSNSILLFSRSARVTTTPLLYNMFWRTRFSGGSAVMSRADKTIDSAITATCIEFDPTKIKVQSGSFTMSGVSSVAVLPSVVTLGSTFVVFSYETDSSVVAMSDAMVRATLTSGSITFNRATSAGTCTGSWFVAEALSGEFAVQHTSSTIAASTATVTSSAFTQISLEKTIVVPSYQTTAPAVDGAEGTCRFTWTTNPAASELQTQYTLTRANGTQPTTIVADIQLVVFSGNEYVGTNPGGGQGQNTIPPHRFPFDDGPPLNPGTDNRYDFPDPGGTLAPGNFVFGDIDSLGIGNHIMPIGTMSFNNMFASSSDSLRPGKGAIRHSLAGGQLTTQPANDAVGSVSDQYQLVFWDLQDPNLTLPSPISMTPVVSVETFEVSIADNEVTKIVAPTLGQTLSNCLLYYTCNVETDTDLGRVRGTKFRTYVSGSNLAIDRRFASASTGNGVATVTLNCIEFDPTKVRVQSGTFDMPANSATFTATIPIAVDTSKTFVVFSVETIFSNVWQAMVRGTITNSTTITFNVGPNSLSLNPSMVKITWFVAEALNTEFSVQRGMTKIPSSSEIQTFFGGTPAHKEQIDGLVGVNSSAQTGSESTVASVKKKKTVVFTSASSDDPAAFSSTIERRVEYFGASVTLKQSDGIDNREAMTEIQACRRSADDDANIILDTEVITFSNDVPIIVHHGEQGFTQGGGGGTSETEISPNHSALIDASTSTALTMTPNGVYSYSSSTASTAPALMRARLVGGQLKLTRNTATGFPLYAGWQIVEWDSIGGVLVTDNNLLIMGGPW